MIQRNKIVFLFLLFGLMVSCFKGKITDIDIENRAVNIAKTLDSSKIEIFKIWGYTPRGEGGVWFRTLGDSVLYSCYYFDYTDSTELMISRFENFLSDYSLNLQLHNIDNSVTITKQENGSIRILGHNSLGYDTVFNSNINEDSVFLFKNPFRDLKYVSNLKDSLNIFSVHYYSDLGGIFQFYLSTQHVLLYIPDINRIDPKYRHSWEIELSAGKKIKSGWSLKKLKKPIDFT